MNIDTLLSISESVAASSLRSMKAACHGANCGRKGRKAGAKPLRSYLTKQESDSLNSKALKVKSRRKARKRY